MVNNNSLKTLNGTNTLIYQKILNLSSSSIKYLETGAILNFINVDANSVIQFINLSPYLFIGPFMILIAIILLVMEVGWIGLIVPIFFLGGTYWQEKLLNKGFEIRKNQLKLLDKRSKCINEYFSGIRIIKYYGW
jgi:ABC-type multidrug transport system fused ATPase/permease subunit